MAVDNSAVARVLGVAVHYKNLGGGSVRYLPQRIAVVGQGASSVTYPDDKKEITSAQQAGQTYGYGSPLHLAAQQLFPSNGDGVGTIPVTLYPLQDDGSGVAASADITPTGTATDTGAFRVRVADVRSNAIVIEEGDDPEAVCGKITAAVNAVLDMPVVATDSSTKVALEAKWAGTSANGLSVVVEGPADIGVTFSTADLADGLVNPDVQPALDQVGNVWESMVLNCLDIEDSAALDAYAMFGEGRWGALVRKPLVVFTGNTAATVSGATAVSETRGTDRTNSQLVAPGSPNAHFVVAARQLARIARLANNNPPHDYGGQRATGLTPGADSAQWDFVQRDKAVKAGSSTVEIKDGVVNISDVVTMYAPEGDPMPAYRFVVDIVKLQTIVFNLDLIFSAAEWDGAPLIPDDQPTVNRDAKKPKMAKAETSAMADSLALEAIISDAEFSKDNTVANIDSQNPKRLNLRMPVKLSGNTNIKAVDLDFGFFFGSKPAL